jgi:excinuclease ABC subunit A
VRAAVNYHSGVIDRITIRGARQHNLKGIDLDLPRRAITVITGPSGSGKSSLAFDTIYAEGQRRYVESLSAYARQFLERMEKPRVDRIEGLSPAVAIEQKNPTRSSRSTVGTATEIYDYLRLLWARVGHTFCGVCGRELTPDTPQSIADAVRTLPEGTRFAVVFPLTHAASLGAEALAEALRVKGFVRLALDGEIVHVDDLVSSKRSIAAVKQIDVVADRLTVNAEVGGRVADAVSTAFAEGDGDCALLFSDAVSLPAGHEPRTRIAFTERFACPDDGTEAPTPSPQLFSFNNPRGACPTCNGFGATLEYDESLIVPYPDRSLRDGAIHPWTMPRYEEPRKKLYEIAKREGISWTTPWKSLSADHRKFLLRGKTKGYTGIYPFLKALEEKRYKQYIRVFLRQYQSAATCATCGGSRLTRDALNVRINGLNIAAVSAMSVDALDQWTDSLSLTPFETTIAETVLREARARVRFLRDVGLGYLSMDRAARTLSGGEAQRIALANSLGAQLVDTLYVLDEPSIGLHPRDMSRLLGLLRRLRDAGNTVIVVEHDLEAVRMADWMVEIGPGSGDKGGEVVFSGPLSDAARSPLTGQYLTGAVTIPLPEKRRTAGPRWLTLNGVTAHTLHDVTVKIPVGCFVCVTGVSGSGKSTLVHDVLYRALETRLTGEHSAKQHLGEIVGNVKSLTGGEHFDDVVLIDQEPIGRSPRSNPVTYVKAWDEIRRIFSQTPLSRQRNYQPATFSFNMAGGRCETCEGAGYVEVEMVFMADVLVPCETCNGKRFKPDVLEVKVWGKNIADVLEMTVDAATRLFPGEDRLAAALWQLQQVGLGYLHLGQPATTLSGGEAQRIKIARELAQSAKSAGRKLYIMDEPTTGLHLEDIRKLSRVLQRLVDQGHTLIVIEHNLDVIKLADWVLDMGPEGGIGGGRVVTVGTPEDVAEDDASHTGRWLRTVLPSYVDGVLVKTPRKRSAKPKSS